jgi:predicted amidohydrolase YtcJ
MLMPTASALDAVDDVDGWLRKAAQFAGPNVRLDRRVKLLADGAFFSQGMRMGAPGYSDGHLGKWLTEPEALNRQLRRYWELGFSLHIHVNGDEGADVVLDGIDALPPGRGQTITLEHLGYATAAQARRIARLGLMVSAQPNYIRVLGEAYAAHGLGPDRAATINRLGSLEREGVTLGLHSDFNMAPIDPFYLAWIALTRQSPGGAVQAPHERLSMAKALRAITIDAAQVIGWDAQVGSLAAGKRADFIALDDDPHQMAADDLKDLPVRAVAFEGQVVREG